LLADTFFLQKLPLSTDHQPIYLKLSFAPPVKTELVNSASEQLLIPRAQPFFESQSQTPSELYEGSSSHEISQYGKIQLFMEDSSVEEIWINSPSRVFIARAGVSELTNLVMSEAEVRNLVERLLMWGGRRLDLSHPFVDARLPDGSRLHASIPDITAQHWAINIRKHLLRGKSIEDLQTLGVMDEAISGFLEKCVAHGLNILVSGSTQAGKTTLLNALMGKVPINSRVITVEEVFELKPRIPDCVALQTRPANLQGEGEIPLRKLIKEALRMRPSHLVVGEIREAESLDLLIALNSGLPGMATIHANSGRDAIAKLQTLPLLAGENISYKFIAPIVANAIDIVVHMGIDADGRRRIIEILYVNGRIEGERVECEDLYYLTSNQNSHLKLQNELNMNQSEDSLSEFPSASYSSGLGDLNRVFDRARSARD
jgi:pilus assembly protein CpaF